MAEREAAQVAKRRARDEAAAAMERQKAKDALERQQKLMPKIERQVTKSAPAKTVSAMSLAETKVEPAKPVKDIIGDFPWIISLLVLLPIDFVDLSLCIIRFCSKQPQSSLLPLPRWKRRLRISRIFLLLSLVALVPNLSPKKLRLTIQWLKLRVRLPLSVVLIHCSLGLLMLYFVVSASSS